MNDQMRNGHTILNPKTLRIMKLCHNIKMDLEEIRCERVY